MNLKENKKIILGMLAGYLVSSYFEIAFPPTWAWILLGMFGLFSSVIYYYWRRLNEDILD